MKKTKVVAFYLPQYHTIPENDKWWGKGFTDWTNVKKAKPLFNDHKQPVKPLNDNYYDLSNIAILKEQADLAKEYGVDGFCYYHYWFKGQKLLEKPLEAMLSDREVNIPFCLSWANDPWTRAWDGGTKDFLIRQDYGSTEDWIDHINYLIPFFRDTRYIKVEERPVFLIYRTKDFSKFDEMIVLWNSILKRNNLKELYIIETLNAFQSQPNLKISEAVVEFEPMISLSSDLTLRERINIFINRKFITEVYDKPRIVSYDSIWKKILSRKPSKFLKLKDQKVLIRSGFVNWDNTPRKKNRGVVFSGGTPEKFETNMRKLLNKSVQSKSEFIFINAWNEWAEGCYLEPDQTNGYEYLNSLKKALKI
jgi:hypothetical protein